MCYFLYPRLSFSSRPGNIAQGRLKVLFVKSSQCPTHDLRQSVIPFPGDHLFK